MSAPVLSLDTDQIAEHNAWLETQTAEQRVAWALKHGPAEAAMSSSFGAQAAVLLARRVVRAELHTHPQQVLEVAAQAAMT